MTPRNPRAAKVAAMRARSELLKARGSQPKTSAEQDAVEPPPIAHFYLKPQLAGPKKLRVGDATFSIPEGSKSRVTLGTHGHAIAAVETPEGTLHFLDELHGEAAMNEALKGPTRALLLSAASVRRTKVKEPPASQVIDPPSIRGTGFHLSLGTVGWPLDPGTRVAQITKRNAAFVLAADGLHYLMALRGRVVEVRMPAKVAAEAMAKFFPETHGSSPSAYAVLPPGPVQK